MSVVAERRTKIGRCYHCWAEGELFADGYCVSLCTDREACIERQNERRRRNWEEGSQAWGVCEGCGEYGQVFEVWHHSGRTKPICVDLACNQRRCERNGHIPGSDVIERLPDMRVRWVTPCTVCHAALTDVVFDA